MLILNLVVFLTHWTVSGALYINGVVVENGPYYFPDNTLDININSALSILNNDITTFSGTVNMDYGSGFYVTRNQNLLQYDVFILGQVMNNGLISFSSSGLILLAPRYDMSGLDNLVNYGSIFFVAEQIPLNSEMYLNAVTNMQMATIILYQGYLPVGQVNFGTNVIKNSGNIYLYNLEYHQQNSI